MQLQSRVSTGLLSGTPNTRGKTYKPGRKECLAWSGGRGAAFAGPPADSHERSVLCLPAVSQGSAIGFHGVSSSFL